MVTLTGIETTLREWGVPVLTGDIVDGTGGTYTPAYVMVHHTVSDPDSGPAPSRNVVRDGRIGLAGPLCQLLVRRDLKVELVTRGRANHAGEGGPWGDIPKDSGNRYCIGIEIEHAGTSAEPWTAEYMAFCRRVAAATLDYLNEPASHLLAHKEWAPDRKTDPYAWAMSSERSKVAALLAAGPNPQPPPEEFPMPEFPFIGVASGQTTAYFVSAQGKRRIPDPAIVDWLEAKLGIKSFTGMSSNVLSLFPTLAVDANNFGVDAATQAQTQLAAIATQLSTLAGQAADDATAAQVQQLAAAVSALALAGADDATSAEVADLRDLVEATHPAPPAP